MYHKVDLCEYAALPVPVAPPSAPRVKSDQPVTFYESPLESPGVQSAGPVAASCGAGSGWHRRCSAFAFPFGNTRSSFLCRADAMPALHCKFRSFAPVSFLQGKDITGAMSTGM